MCTPTVSEVQDQTKTIGIGTRNLILPLALSTVRETDSVIKARNGQVVVIGGLIRDVTRDNQAEVPFLGDLPIFGDLFTQKRQSQEKTELVILIRPSIGNADTIGQDLEAAGTRFEVLRKRIDNDYKALMGAMLHRMYEHHFGLARLPFTLTPNTRFYLRAQSHDRAFATVIHALKGREGFIKVTGQVGTGKTLLCRRAAQRTEVAFHYCLYSQSAAGSA